MKILLVGGTRFVGKALVKKLIKKGHDLTLFTRGNIPAPKNTRHIIGDRNKIDDLKLIEGIKYDVIIDSSGRELDQTKMLLNYSKLPNYRYIYISSAGVYSNAEEFPLTEDSHIDKTSRHIGKAETESWLIKEGVPFTSFRPTYIYGPGNYNPIEKWFFDRIIYKSSIPIPGDGNLLTQLGHVSDLADAIDLSLECSKCTNRIYNISSKKAITIKGLINSAITATNRSISDIEFRPFNFENLDKKSRKIFPLRLTHFFTDISAIERDLNWSPNFDLTKGLLDSYNNDYLINQNSKPDFSLDENLFL